jgi:hypothetical protein
MRCKFRFLITALASILTFVSFSQKDILSFTTLIPSDQSLHTKKDYLDYLTAQYGWTFSYNANSLAVDEPVKLNYQISTLESVLGQIFANEQLVITIQPPKKIILQSKGKKRKDIILSGTITDQNTGESIFGAIVLESKSGISAITNEKGYFIMELPKGSEAHLTSSYIAYLKNTTIVSLDDHKSINIKLLSNNLIDTIYVEDPKSRLQLTDGGNIIDVFKNLEFNSIIGERDIIANTRVLPGVQSGGEGQSGLYVRGGTPDQNLILMEGVALYETSHVAGISSIFMDESIKEASFIRNGFPARYGGRLASVLDVQLKEGDKKKHHTHLSAGLAGAKVHFNGPIVNEKTTYTLTARTSWVNFYINSLLSKYTKYDAININYHDILGKVTRHFSPSHSLSFTLYNGSDRLQLQKNNIISEPTYQLNIFDRNGINWRNSLGSLKWNFLISDKWSFKIQTGMIKYNNGSRSSYIFETTDSDTSYVDQLDVLTRSQITDINARVDIDYYLNEKHVIRGGINYINQNFNPTVKQSKVLLQGNEENIIDSDSVIIANQYQIYLEENFKLNQNFFLYGGFHIGTFRQGNKTYQSWQPRLKLIWTPHPKHMISGAYSQMTQFIHLLSNSGLGLPSELWVPSTEKISPQNAEQLSFSYTYNLNKSSYINVGAYNRLIKNTLEYTTPVELFYFLINDQNIVPVYNTSRDWERNILSGSSTSKGLEFLFHKSKGKTKGWASLTWSKTLKSFEEINEGVAFPASHDKTWNINSGLNHQFSGAFSMGMQFVYNTGNAFSLATEEYGSLLGITLLNSNGRNNYRLPDFHQLSLNSNYTIKKDKFNLTIGFNIYNIYNRLNAYYIYIYKNPSQPNDIISKKVSILPFTPSFTISTIF